MYEVDWNIIIRNATPPRLYTTGIVAWLSVMIQSIQNIHSWFISFTQDKTYDLTHNGQVVYLEAALNDSFDPVNRAIYISNAGGESVTPLFPDGDLKEIILQLDSPTTVFPLQKDSGYEGGEFDFIVNVPFGLTQSDRFRMEALLDKYKLASKRYDIRTA